MFVGLLLPTGSHTHTDEAQNQNYFSSGDSAAQSPSPRFFLGGGETARGPTGQQTAAAFVSAFHTPNVSAQESGYDRVGGLGMAVSVWISWFPSFASRSLVESVTTKIQTGSRCKERMNA